MASIDIIIPTYNNASEITYTLRGLFEQHIPPDWSPGIVVTDDGSDDTTAKIVSSMVPPPSWRPSTVIAASHQGAAAARNRALRHSSAELILLLGADIILRPGALAAHLKFHDAYPGQRHAVVGMIKWDPRLKPSPLMEWMMHGGGQNDFDSLLGQRTADPCHFFYGSHLSLKRSALGQERFPEVYQSYGWEDLDLGRKLSSRLTLHSVPEAVALHRHAYTLRDIKRRQYLVGRSLTMYQRRYPRVVLLPRKSKLHRAKVMLLTYLGAAQALHLFLFFTEQRWSTPRLFGIFTTLNLWRGVYDTLRIQPTP